MLVSGRVRTITTCSWIDFVFFLGGRAKDF